VFDRVAEGFASVAVVEPGTERVGEDEVRLLVRRGEPALAEQLGDARGEDHLAPSGWNLAVYADQASLVVDFRPAHSLVPAAHDGAVADPVPAFGEAKDLF